MIRTFNKMKPGSPLYFVVKRTVKHPIKSKDVITNIDHKAMLTPDHMFTFTQYVVVKKVPNIYHNGLPLLCSSAGDGRSFVDFALYSSQQMSGNKDTVDNNSEPIQLLNHSCAIRDLGNTVFISTTKQKADEYAYAANKLAYANVLVQVNNIFASANSFYQNEVSITINYLPSLFKSTMQWLKKRNIKVVTFQPTQPNR